MLTKVGKVYEMNVTVCTRQGGETLTVTCFTCGMPSSKDWAQKVKSQSGGTNQAYFPFLLQTAPPPGASLKDDGSAYLCAFCHASLDYQWKQYEGQQQGSYVHPIQRKYSLQKFICAVCGVETYRKRVRALPFQEFPFLVKQRQPKSLTLGDNPLAVVCLDCSETLWAQSAEYDRWGLPIHKRHFNWMARPPPPENSVEATVARLPSGETQLPRCPATEPLAPSKLAAAPPECITPLKSKGKSDSPVLPSGELESARTRKLSASTALTNSSTVCSTKSINNAVASQPPIVTVAPMSTPAVILSRSNSNIPGTIMPPNLLSPTYNGSTTDRLLLMPSSITPLLNPPLYSRASAYPPVATSSEFPWGVHGSNGSDLSIHIPNPQITGSFGSPVQSTGNQEWGAWIPPNANVLRISLADTAYSSTPPAFTVPMNRRSPSPSPREHDSSPPPMTQQVLTQRTTYSIVTDNGSDHPNVNGNCSPSHLPESVSRRLSNAEFFDYSESGTEDNASILEQSLEPNENKNSKPFCGKFKKMKRVSNDVVQEDDGLTSKAAEIKAKAYCKPSKLRKSSKQLVPPKKWKWPLSESIDRSSIIKSCHKLNKNPKISTVHSKDPKAVIEGPMETTVAPCDVAIDLSCSQNSKDYTPHNSAYNCSSQFSIEYLSKSEGLECTTNGSLNSIASEENLFDVDSRDKSSKVNESNKKISSGYKPKSLWNSNLELFSTKKMDSTLAICKDKSLQVRQQKHSDENQSNEISEKEETYVKNFIKRFKRRERKARLQENIAKMKKTAFLKNVGLITIEERKNIELQNLVRRSKHGTLPCLKRCYKKPKKRNLLNPLFVSSLKKASNNQPEMDEPQSQEKVNFMESLGLKKASDSQKKKIHDAWQLVLADQALRNKRNQTQKTSSHAWEDPEYSKDLLLSLPKTFTKETWSDKEVARTIDGSQSTETLIKIEENAQVNNNDGDACVFKDDVGNFVSEVSTMNCHNEDGSSDVKPDKIDDLPPEQSQPCNIPALRSQPILKIPVVPKPSSMFSHEGNKVNEIRNLIKNINRDWTQMENVFSNYFCTLTRIEPEDNGLPEELKGMKSMVQEVRVLLKNKQLSVKSIEKALKGKEKAQKMTSKKGL